MLSQRQLSLFPIFCAAVLAMGLVVAEAEPGGAPTPSATLSRSAVAMRAPAAPATVTETATVTLTQTVVPAKPNETPKTKSHKHTKAKKAKPRHKQQPKSVITHRMHPGWVTLGHYIRSLHGNGNAWDLVRMRRLGRSDAHRNPSQTQHFVLMDIGGQVRGGVFLSTTHKFISYRSLVRAMNAYVQGYAQRQHSRAPVIIAIGTNNDLRVTVGTGASWARHVVNPIASYARRFKQITVAGANDMEPGFRGSPGETRQWLNGYLANTRAQFVFNGSADGCSSRHTFSNCNRGWRAIDLVRLAGRVAPERILVLPQIYNNTMAGQWAMISKTAVRAGFARLRIIGPLTENRACEGDPYCPTMPSWQAFRRLRSHLHRVGLRSTALSVQVDLDVR